VEPKEFFNPFPLTSVLKVVEARSDDAYSFYSGFGLGETILLVFI
jgi:hypothetical protein